MRDFAISTWGRYLIVVAETPRAVAWLSDHWRAPCEPPCTRATKVARMLSELMYVWDNYEPSYTYTLSPAAHDMLQDHERIG